MIANPALTMKCECRSILSERATLDPFETLAGKTPALQQTPWSASPSRSPTPESSAALEMRTCTSPPFRKTAQRPIGC
jgi:hypothetical protein